MRRFSLLLLFCLVLIGASAPRTKPKIDVKRGEQVYKALCWTCHGNYGRGDGPAAQYLARIPPDLTDPRILGAKSEQQLLTDLLEEGKGDGRGNHRTMIIGEVLKKDPLLDAIAYMRTLSIPGKHVSIQAGRDIYNTFCWTCHGTKGDGQGPAAKNLVGAKPRNFVSKDFVVEGREEEIQRTIFEGAAKTFHGSPYMPEWKSTLSRQQILDVLEYLKTFKKPKT